MSVWWGWEGADCQVSSLTMETAMRAAAVFFIHAIFTPLFLCLPTCRSTVLHLQQQGYKYYLLEVVKVREWDGKDKSDKDTLEKKQKQVYKRRNVMKKKVRKGG